MLFIGNTVSVDETYTQCNRNHYNLCMSFGKTLAEKRKQAGLNQQELADRTALSISYISALEREEPVGKYGKPRKPTVEVVDKLAKALDWADARITAGYLPEQPLERPKPQTVQELLDRLSELGVEAPIFKGGIENLPDDPDVLDDILRVISMTVEIELRKHPNNASQINRGSVLHK